jgi:glutamine amidotransferase
MIAIVDYNAGNLTSVKLALKKIGEECVITSESKVILDADRVVFPGVGAAGTAMGNIRRLALHETLPRFISTGRPLLGICLGAQIILETSRENNNTRCMEILAGTTDIFLSTSEYPLKVPQIGWNQVEFIIDHPLFYNIENGSEFYFVHSYYPVPAKSENIFAQTTYGGTTFSSVLGKENLVACQFHPEKSGKPGLQMLKNFCKWEGFPGTLPC